MTPQLFDFIDYCELWGERFASGFADDLCQQALRQVGLRAQWWQGEVVGLRQVRPGVWARESS